jgi:hypothetical protein
VIRQRRVPVLSCHTAALPQALSRAKIRQEKGLAFAGRCVKTHALFFSVKVRSKSGAPPVGASKQFLIWLSGSCRQPCDSRGERTNAVHHQRGWFGFNEAMKACH